MKTTKDNMNNTNKAFLTAACAMGLVISSGMASAGFIDYDHRAESVGNSVPASTQLSNGQPGSWSGFIDYDHSPESARNSVSSESDAVMHQSDSMQGFVDYDHSAESIRS